MILSKEAGGLGKCHNDAKEMFLLGNAPLHPLPTANNKVSFINPGEGIPGAVKQVGLIVRPI